MTFATFTDIRVANIANLLMKDPEHVAKKSKKIFYQSAYLHSQTPGIKTDEVWKECSARESRPASRLKVYRVTSWR